MIARDAPDDMPEKARRQGERPLLMRSLALLERIAAADRSLSLAELSEALSVPKPTVFRIAQKLEHAGYLAREPGNGGFCVGPRLLRLGLDAARTGGANAERRATLEALVAKLGETCNFTALSGSEVVYLDRVETRWPLRLNLEPGSRVPLHCTASGKLFLAHMQPERRRRLLERLPLTPETPATLIDPVQLEAECARILRQDYSTDSEEFLVGLIAVAVPVRDAGGTVVAAVACHAPSARLPLAEALKRLPELRDAAQKLGASLHD